MSRPKRPADKPEGHNVPPAPAERLLDLPAHVRQAILEELALE
jgi:hypothetical protein